MRHFAVYMLPVLLFISCGIHNGDGGSSTSLESITSFIFQLQNVDIDALAASAHNMVIIDYSEDGSEANKWSTADIETLKKSGKTVIAYLSIGEAESYRYYWDSSWSTTPPDWLGKENPDWAGNYKVKYWNSDWQDIIKGYLDKIIDLGFDGVYLDIVDGYWYWSNEATDAGEDEQIDTTLAADRMITFIETLTNYARVHNGEPDFLIIPQNGSDIINDCSSENLSLYYSCINGIGAECTFFDGDNDMDNSYNVATDTLDNLIEIHAHDKMVFCIEYLSESNTSSITQFKEECSIYGFIPYAADIDLDTLRSPL